MSNILEYFESIKAQEQINKWTERLQNKKIVIYGAGNYFEILYDNYDLSKLNIIGICDRKFETCKDSNKTNFNTIIPKELAQYNFDVILTALFDDTKVIKDLEKTIKKPIESIVEPDFWYCLKILLGFKK